jgi:Phage tail lysozyme
VAVPALGLLGGFVAYQAQPSTPSHPSSSTAAFHVASLVPGDVTADGSGRLIAGRPVSGTASQKTNASRTTGTKAKTAGRRPAVRAGAARQSNGAAAPASSPAASPSPTPSPSKSGRASKNLKAAVQADIASGNYLLAVGQYLVENGYSEAAAAGVASCIDGESGGNPESVGSGGGGLIGWTPISSAAPNSNIITGNAAQDMMAQLSDLLYYNSTEIGQSLVDQLDSISDPVAAADFFSQNFERPAVTDSDVVPSVAEQIYSDLSS